jgi:hypothetical protein
VAYLTMGERGVIRVPGPVTVESFSLLPFEARLVSGELADGGSAVPICDADLKSPLGFVALSFASPFSVCLMIRVEKRRGGGEGMMLGVSVLGLYKFLWL